MLLHLMHKDMYGFPGGLAVKNPPDNAGESGSISGLGRSNRGGNGNSLQLSLLGNPMEKRNLEGYSSWGHKELDMT